MLKQLKTGIMKVFSKKWVIVVVSIILVSGLYLYSYKKNHRYDMMTTGYEGEEGEGEGEGDEEVLYDYDPSLEEPMGNFNSGSQYTMQPVSNPSDLLPSDSNSQWASLNPISQGNVAIPDLLQSGFHIGLDSIGQSLKNANYQNRADPVIERQPTGIWNQSTIDTDIGRVSME